MRQLKINQSTTIRGLNSLDKYLIDIKKEELISPEEEVLLAQRIKEGDQWALEKLCKANLRFVVSVAKQYQNQGLSLPDLISEGNLGLIKAAQRFDETRGFKFISYAVWWIRQAILQALAEYSNTIRIPMNQLNLRRMAKKEAARLEQEFQRSPSLKEVSESLKKSESLIDGAFLSSQKIFMDAPIGAMDEDTLLIDTFINQGPLTDEGLINESLLIEINHVLETLSERERQVIRLFYGFSGPAMTLEEIGSEFDMTRERVRQIREKALRRIRHSKRSRILKDYI